MTTKTTYEIGYSEAHFLPRYRWGGDKHHAVDADTVVTSRGGRARYGRALCGIDVTAGGQDFDPSSVSACKRCAKAVAR